MSWNDGSVYEGMFQYDTISGQGKLTWSDGRSYSGSWVNQKMNGQGIF